MFFGFEEYLHKWLTLQHKGDEYWCSGSAEPPSVSPVPIPQAPEILDVTDFPTAVLLQLMPSPPPPWLSRPGAQHWPRETC